MDFPIFKSLVKEISIGKKLPDSIYVHVSALGSIPLELTDAVLKITTALEISDNAWNIVKFNKRDFKLNF